MTGDKTAGAWFVVDHDHPSGRRPIVSGPWTTSTDAGRDRRRIEADPSEERNLWVERRSVAR